ncbi:hypothetical protein D3C76_1127810 [compost metagenome]
MAGDPAAVVPVAANAVRIDHQEPFPVGQHVEAIAAVPAHLLAVAARAVQHHQQGRIFRQLAWHVEDIVAAQPGHPQGGILTAAGQRRTPEHFARHVPPDTDQQQRHQCDDDELQQAYDDAHHTSCLAGRPAFARAIAFCRYMANRPMANFSR